MGVVCDDVVDADAGDAEEPRDHNGSKYKGNPVRTIMLKCK